MKLRSMAAGLACAGLLVAACGDDDDEAAETGAGPTTTEAPPETQPNATDEGEVPERIVSLSATGTEMLYAVGAGDLVVAVDDQSDFPEGVPTTNLSGYTPNLEAILEHDPDLVVVSGSPPDLGTGLESADVDVLDLPAPATIDEAYEQITNVGIVTGHEDEAADLVTDMQADIDELVASVPERAEEPTYYHELTQDLYTATSTTFIGQIYDLAGLDNVADAADASGEFGGYPQVSAELLVSSDPDFVFLADTECCAQSAETLAQRPGFGDLTAIQEGRVVELSDDVASRWGPRIVDLLRTIIEATASFS